MSADVLNSIHNKLPSLSKGRKRIAEYILSYYDKAAFLTASALGKAVQVSESTVVRFASELGYEGYPQMQKALQEMVLTNFTSVQRIEATAKHLDEEDILTSVLLGDMERIRKSNEQLDRCAFEGAAQAILNARRVYVMGVRSSSALASFLSFYLNYMLEDVRLITTSSDSEIFERIAQMRSEDVLFGISFPRYSSATAQAMKYGKSTGAKIVALTDCAASPLADMADYLLCARSDMLSLVDSLVAPMSVVNALLATIASHRKGEMAKNFDKLEEIWDMYHVYEKIGD